MGVNNKQRRAAKRRKQARQDAGNGSRPDPGWDEAAAYQLADLQVTSTVRRISRRSVDELQLREQAESLVRRVQPVPHHVVEYVLADLLSRLAEGVVRGGWGHTDLTELVRRRGGSLHLPMLTAVLQGERLRLGTVDELGSGLQVAALLATAPRLDADAVIKAPTDQRAEHPKLARVRALLAKAESTEYDDEAEALTAKAQELISRYALDRLVTRAGSETGREEPAIRRIWLDAPYVQAKATLVHVVAEANRCQSVITVRLGFCLVVGAAGDLDAVELLVTSLLVQADAAMLRHGRRFDQSGISRTRSFRQSFLSAYATRIGERLRAVTSDAAEATDAARLLPVLRDHERRVSEAFTAMVGDTFQKDINVSNGEGWVAGAMAADLALLDVNGRLPERTG